MCLQQPSQSSCARVMPVIISADTLCPKLSCPWIQASAVETQPLIHLKRNLLTRIRPRGFQEGAGSCFDLLQFSDLFKACRKVGKSIFGRLCHPKETVATMTTAVRQIASNYCDTELICPTRRFHKKGLGQHRVPRTNLNSNLARSP